MSIQDAKERLSEFKVIHKEKGDFDAFSGTEFMSLVKEVNDALRADGTQLVCGSHCNNHCVKHGVEVK